MHLLKQASQPIPLGLSDLTQDECLIISVARAWRRLGLPRAEAEAGIAQLLQSDRVYPALGPLFAVFRALMIFEPLASEDCDLLSHGEEALLDQLAADDQGRVVRDCQTALHLADIELRPLQTIQRSGKDRLEDRIARCYQSLMHAC